MIFFHLSEEAASSVVKVSPWLSQCLDSMPSFEEAAADGEIALGLSVKAVMYETAVPSPCVFETHRDHIDVQVCLEGSERIQLVRRSQLKGATDLDDHGDVIFYDQPERATDSIEMTEGSVLVLYPEDAHRCGEKVDGCGGVLKKLVFKVHRSLW